MNMDDWSTARLLNTAARLRGRGENERLRASGLSHAGLIMARVLIAQGALSQVDLAQRLHIQPQTAGRTLDRLEALGYVQRGRAEQDRRIVLVAATDAGRHAVDTLDAGEARLDEATGLSDQALRAGLEHIIRSIRPDAFGDGPQLSSVPDVVRQ